MSKYGSPDLSGYNNKKYEFTKCRKCNAEYFKSYKRCPECQSTNSPFKSILIYLSILLMVAGVLGFGKIKAANDVQMSYDPLVPAESGNNLAYVPTGTPPVETPKTGIHQIYTTDRLIAPFKIITSGSQNHHYVKLIDPSSKDPVVSIFINKGESAEVTVPLGQYEILYTSGTTWYGGLDLFGPGTEFLSLNKTYSFALSGDRTSVNGWTIQLD